MDLYEVLAVPHTATTDEIRKAYLRLARERHPDRFQDRIEKERAQEFFKELTEAFNTLGNERSRREYDASLAAPPPPTTPAELAEKAFGEGLAALGSDPVRAAEAFRVALHHLPGEARFHAALGRALARVPQRGHDAVQEFETALRLQPREVAWQIELGATLLAQGLKLRARKHAEAALRLAPDSAEARRLAEDAGLLDEQGDGGRGEGGGLLSRLRRKP